MRGTRIFYRNGTTIAMPNFENVQPHIGIEFEIPGDADAETLDDMADLAENWVDGRLEEKRQKILKEYGD